MNTDKNGWPYLLAVGLTFTSFGTVMSSNLAPFWVWVGVIGSLWFFGFFVPLFLTMVFSQTLKPVSLHRKLVFSFCPFMYFHLPSRYWVLKQLAPDRNY